MQTDFKLCCIYMPTSTFCKTPAHMALDMTIPGLEVIKLFSCSTQLSTKYQLLIKSKIPTNKDVSCFKPLRCCIYEGCSNMNASSFITFFTYMLRQNVIPFWKELFVAFKMAPNIKKNSLYFSSYRRLYKGHSCILAFF